MKERSNDLFFLYHLMEKIDLITAIVIITKTIKQKITAIEYEDGSGKCFNYKVLGDDKYHFFRLVD